MIAFIDDHRDVYGVEPICKVLPIAPSTYHAHVARRADPEKLSRRAKRDATLKAEIRRVFEANFAAQRSSALDEECLVDGFVADAHCLVVREVDRQAPGNLFRAPGPGPSPILSLAMPAAVPGHGRTGNGNAARSGDDASQSLLHISAQGRVECKLRRFRATGRSLGMPLGGRRAILQSTAAGGCVAPQLTGDRRGGSTEPAPDLLHGMALDPEKRNLLALHQRQIPPGERLRRGSEHRWGHAAGLSEPSASY